MPGALLLIVFALSGAGALVVETVWMRWFQDWLGATAPATASTVTAFFAGSAVGSWLGARLARGAGTRAAALRRFAGAQLAAALAALAMPLLFEAAAVGLGTVSAAASPRLLSAVRFAVALVVTLPAAAAYGAALPLMAAAAVSSPREIGRRVTMLYAANLAGAVCGVAVATWWGPPAVGVRATYAIGIGLTLLAGLAGLRRRPRAAPTRRAAEGGRAWPARQAIALAALSGFVSLSAQVLLVRAVAHVVNQSVTAFGAVLIAVLLCLAAGALLVAALQARRLAGAGAIGASACAAAALGLALVPTALHWVTGGLDYVGGGDAIPYALIVLAVVLGAAGPALIAAGCIWPAALALAGEAAETGDAAGGGAAGHRVGILAAANTGGAVVAGVVTPFVVLPALGPWGGFLVSAAAAALGAIALLCADRRLPAARRWRRAGVVLGGALLIGLMANPLALPLARRAAGERVLAEHSGAAATVTVVERDGERLLRLDGHYALGGTGELRHEARQGHLPLLLHGRPRRVAFVGTATGITAGAALDHEVEAVTLVEIVPEVAAAAAAHFFDANRGIYGDARAHVVLDDARNYWRYTGDRYDVIVADLFVPWQAGTGALYSREHFEAMRERLAPGGLLAQWLPIYQLSAPELRSIVATFTDVFPVAAVFRGDFFAGFPIVALVGWRDAPAPAADVAAAVRRLGARGVGDRWLTDPAAFFALYLAPLDPRASDGVPRNRLDRPWIEYEAAARHIGGERGKRDALHGLAWLAEVEAWQAAAPRPDALYPNLPPPAQRARAGGDALQRAGALWSAGRADDAAAALAIAADTLPPSVVADAPPDASAVDVWR